MPAKSCVVGIAGGSAAGKTSLTRVLKEFLEEQVVSVEVVSVDAFYHADRSKGPTFVSPSRGDKHFNFNDPSAIDQERLLAHLVARSTAQEAPQVLLVEGLMVLHIAAIREILGVRLFVELEADVRALRRLLRDAKGARGDTDPQWIATYYLESARVGHELFVEPSRKYADFIVRGDADFARIVPLLSGMITGALTS